MEKHSTATVTVSELELAYTERVNMAVAEDRYDLVAELTAEFDHEVSQLTPAA